ncbi:hypothetical protein L207DRAFT_197428 [Hyaloscypha variabilis F]|uniref:Uncharacterized protein n=1 Tax=Hyaloscypha variabilis (strain UAMH 11265 / GT02V1 / F) TaxID=1149755 RepID=A0A2J6QXW7_HYAVF|nr:hypothetical protein L207DRAFT_197428 [Hyaloscypha variabilis F]
MFIQLNNSIRLSRIDRKPKLLIRIRLYHTQRVRHGILHKPRCSLDTYRTKTAAILRSIKQFTRAISFHRVIIDFLRFGRLVGVHAQFLAYCTVVEIVVVCRRRSKMESAVTENLRPGPSPNVDCLLREFSILGVLCCVFGAPDRAENDCVLSKIGGIVGGMRPS